MPIVKLYANLRKLAGTKEVSVSGTTVRAVVTELIKQNPPLDEVIFTGENLRPHIVIMLNGHNVVDMDVNVRDQDVVAIFPPIAGGQD